MTPTERIEKLEKELADLKRDMEKVPDDIFVQPNPVGPPFLGESSYLAFSRKGKDSIHFKKVLPPDPDVEVREVWVNVYEEIDNVAVHAERSLATRGAGSDAVAVAVPVRIEFKRKK